MRAKVLFVVVSVAVLGFAPAPLPRKDRRGEDPTDLTGVWRFVRCDTNGVPDKPETFTEYRIEITRDQIAFIPRGGQRSPLGMTLNPAASPPSFTWSIGREVNYVGSYRLERGELTMIFVISGRLEDRPRDFTNKPPFCYVMRRVSR